MSDGSPSKEVFQAYEKEYQGIRHGVANATLAWSAVENSMVELLTAILNRENMGIPAAMYFALSGIDARLTMVSDAATELFYEVKQRELEQKIEPPCADRIESLWGTLFSRLKGLKGTRNKIAHGQIVGVDLVRTGENAFMAFPRLTSPALNFSHFREAREKGESPGMTANDIHVHQQAVYSAAATVQSFEKCIRLIHADNREALLEKLAQLEAERQRRAGQDSQTHEEHPNASGDHLL